MANIPYLGGDETPTAALVNKIVQALEGKMTQILGGRTVLMAQSVAMPAWLFGKCFFFTSGPCVYSPMAPGFVDSGAGGTLGTDPITGLPTNIILSNAPVAYNHALFTTAIAAYDFTKMYDATLAPNGVVAWDTLDKIVEVPQVNNMKYGMLPVTPVGLDYAGNPQPPNSVCTLFDWSLAAHYVMRQDPVADLMPVKYYIRETSREVTAAGNCKPAPEKNYKYALAEIIVEGPLAVSIPAAYDKYQCFRIHNCNAAAITVTFDNFTVTVPMFGSQIVRRDLIASTTVASQGTNYRLGGHYFFSYEANDPRFYWFLPSNGMSVVDDGRAANSMHANNLSNFSILFDWIQYFTRTVDFTALSGSTVFAGFNQDPKVQCDISAWYGNYYGDVTKPGTLLGDVLHHKGDILIIRQSKTQVDAIAGWPTVTVDRVTFNGYTTIVADFGAHKLTVAPNAGGDLVISNADTANDIYLVSISTNLLKAGESIPSMVDLTGTKTFTIESAIFDPGTNTVPAALQLQSTAPTVISQPLVTHFTPSQQYMGSWTATELTTVNGTPQTYLDWSPAQNNPVSLISAFPANGGSGYLAGDQLEATGGNPFLIGGTTPCPATFAVTAVNASGGVQANGLQVTSPGFYTGAAGVTNSPAYITPPGIGTGLVLNLTWNVQAIHGIHAVTLGSLLNLQFWGAPLTSALYQTFSNQKFMLTPDGLTLCFDETDSYLPPQALATYPSATVGVAGVDWALGYRGVVKHFAIKFRGHGFGYKNGMGANTTAWLSCRTLRYLSQSSTPTYPSEILGVSGADFGLPLNFAQQAQIQIQKRLDVSGFALSDAENQGRPGLAGGCRFFQTAGGDVLQYFLNNYTALPSYNVISVANGIYTLDTGGALKVPPAQTFGTWFHENITVLLTNNLVTAAQTNIAMVLLPEMYNALAREVNAITKGVPLSWRCLKFAITDALGNVTAIDASFNDSTFQPEVTPMTHYGCFASGSPQAQLATQLGIPIRSVSDFPGGASNGGTISYANAQGEQNVSALFALNASGSVSTPSQYGTGGDNWGSYYDFNWSASMTAPVLIDGLALLAGTAPADPNCLGVIDPANPMYTYKVNIDPITHAQRGFTGYFPVSATPGQYVVVGTADGGLNVGDILVLHHFQDVGGNVIWGAGIQPYTAASVTVYPPINLQTGIAYMPNGDPIDLVNSWILNPDLGLAAGTTYQWVAIADVQAALARYGLPFLWAEVCAPLSLEYFNGVTMTSAMYNASQSGTQAHIYVEFNGYDQDNRGYNNNANYSVGTTAFIGGPWARVLRFVMTKDHSAALWKTASVAPAIGQNNGMSPVEVCNIKSRSGASPFVGWSRMAFAFGSFGTTGFGFGATESGNAPSTLPDADALTSFFGSNDDYYQSLYNGTSLMDAVEYAAINIYASQPINPINVLMCPVAAWARQTDWWTGSADNQAAVSANIGLIPPVFLDPGTTSTTMVIAGTTPVNIIAPPQSNKLYWCCFDITAVGIALL